MRRLGGPGQCQGVARVIYTRVDVHGFMWFVSFRCHMRKRHRYSPGIHSNSLANFSELLANAHRRLVDTKLLLKPTGPWYYRVLTATKIVTIFDSRSATCLKYLVR